VNLEEPPLAEKRLRLVVADDNSAFLEKLVAILAVQFDVVATAADGQSALALIRQHKPDVAVLDLNMPVLDGMEVTRELAKDPQSPPVVICSVETDPEIIRAAREAGAMAYVTKVQIPRHLIEAVKSAAKLYFVSL
jgi:CheY-like chemotaxis protein